MKNTFVYLLLVILAATSLSVSAQTAMRGDEEETAARVANPDSTAEGKDCPPCLQAKRLATKLNDNSQSLEQVVKSALGIRGDTSRKGEGQTQ